jgi:sporulation protein YlmC with PRC-barrel domain
VLRLTELLGSAVVDGSGRRIGRLVDVGVRLVDPHPPATSILVGARRRVFSAPWEAVGTMEPGRIELRSPLNAAGTEGDLLLGRHVLDVQIVDVAGKRVERVGDVELAARGDTLFLLGVEVGPSPMLRRLGLALLARRTRSETVDWRDLHITSLRGHTLQLAAPASAVHRLGPEELAELEASLPPVRAEELAEALPAAPRPPRRRPGRRFRFRLLRRAPP